MTEKNNKKFVGVISIGIQIKSHSSISVVYFIFKLKLTKVQFDIPFKIVSNFSIHYKLDYVHLKNNNFSV